MNVLILTSTTHDGSMKPVNGDDEAVTKNRTAFLQNNGLRTDDTTLLHLTYGGTNHTRYMIVHDELRGDGIVRQSSIEVDALVTTQPNHVLLLPLADCIGAVLQDPINNILMLSHLGRHNLEQYGGIKSIEFLSTKFGSDPKTITVWLSPAAGQKNYPLFSFENRGMHDVATEQLVTAGILPDNITASAIDTTTDPDYFSHSQFLAGNRATDGRFAVAAVMRQENNT
jgi:copper oxidase (laccase) domain-containing protein